MQLKMKSKSSMKVTNNTINNKLSEDMNEIKDAFKYYDQDNQGVINRKNLRSILGNFAYTKMNGKQIQDQIGIIYGDQQKFGIDQVLDLIIKKWFRGGKQQQALDMFNLFDKKQRGLIGLNQIKSVFNQYLDINISDHDINQFIQEADFDKDGYLNQKEFYNKLGYH